MKKKIFAILAAVLMTTATTFAASTYIYSIDCGDGVIHQGYIGANDKAEALEVAYAIAQVIC